MKASWMKLEYQVKLIHLNIRNNGAAKYFYTCTACFLQADSAA